jgi:hypothetical protein
MVQFTSWVAVPYLAKSRVTRKTGAKMMKIE